MSAVKEEDFVKKIVVYEDVGFWLFHPQKKPKRLWNVVVSFLLIYTATIMPYKMAYIDSEFGDDWFVIDMTIDVLFFLDVLVNWTTAYHDELEGMLITSRKKILLNYLKSWMILDIIACFPFGLIENDDQSQ